MNEEAKEPKSQPAPEAEAKPVAPEAPPAPPALKEIVVANGETVKLQPPESALLVTLNHQTGFLSIYDVQNCSSRATAKMILNCAMDRYRSIEIADEVLNLFSRIQAQEEAKKRNGIVIPGFGKRK